MRYLSLLLLVALPGFGFEISSVKVGGDKEALVQLVGEGGKPSGSSFKISGNTVEVTLGNSYLKAVHQGKLDVSSPHALIHRVSVYEAANKQAKALVVINGSLEGLKNRLAISENETGVSLKVEYPKVGNSTLELLKEEQLPLNDTSPSVKKENKEFHWVQIVLFLIVVVGAGASTFFFVKYAKAKGSWGGSRKYLVEQLSYVPVGGTKSGVALVKVGSEFVLLGVTPSQVSLLSNLPKLAQQYEEENLFEKSTFNEAVKEQMKAKNFNV
ncbi:MAG: FliO/MopB family protein [Deltaproteobacteria bacterium]